METTTTRWQTTAISIAAVALVAGGGVLLHISPFGTSSFVEGGAWLLGGALLFLWREPLALWISGLWWRRSYPSRPLSPLRKVKPRYFASLLSVLLWLLSALYVLCTGWYVVQRTWVTYELGRVGQSTVAQIINNEGEKSSAELGFASLGNRGAVLYAYRVGNIAYTGTMVAEGADRARMRFGTRLQVTYLPSHPQEHLVGRVTNSAVVLRILSYWVMELLGFVAFSFPALLWTQKVRRQQFLARYGLECEGVITRSRRLKRWGYALYKIGYRYRVNKEYEGVAAVRTFSPGRFAPVESTEPLLKDFPIRLVYDPRYPWYSCPVMNLRLVGLRRESLGDNIPNRPSSSISS